MTLNDYLTRTRRLLRDSTQTLYPTPDLIQYVNEARHQRDLGVRAVRTVLGFDTVAGQSTYSLATIKAGGTLIRGEATCLPRDVVSLQLIPQGGAAGGMGLRAPLGRRPYSWLSTYVSTSWLSYPAFFARLGLDTVVLAPPPAQAYPMEWDLIGIYPDLVDPGDVDPMPDPWNDPVPYLAAAIAKDNAQRFDEADQFEKRYDQRLMRIRDGIRQLAIPNPLADVPRG